MNELITEVTLRTTYEFFAVGVLCGSIYYLVTLFFSALKTVAAKDVISVLLAGSYKKAFSMIGPAASAQTSPRVNDGLRALLILTAGVLFSFMSFALTDGIPRIYTLAATMLGIVFVGALLRSCAGYAISFVSVWCVMFFVSAVLFPARMLLRILSIKKKN